MTPNLLYLVILVASQVLLVKTSPRTTTKLKVLVKRDIWDEAVSTWVHAQNTVSFNVAPSYGTLNAKSLQRLDESLKVMMGGILRMDLPQGYTWKELKYALDTNKLMIRHPDMSAFNLKGISFSSTRFFGIGSDKSKRLKHIYSWFTELIGNVNILANANIDLNEVAMMVSKISADMMGNLWSNKIKKKNLMDLGILRFPDIDNPFFSLYRINLLAKCTYDTYILHQRETSEIVGLFQREVYYPDRNYIRSLSGDLTEQILSEVDDLFS